MDLADRVLGPGPNPVPNQVQAFELMPLFCGAPLPVSESAKTVKQKHHCLQLPEVTLHLFVQYFDQSALQVNSLNNVGWRIAWLTFAQGKSHAWRTGTCVCGLLPSR